MRPGPFPANTSAPGRPPAPGFGVVGLKFERFPCDSCRCLYVIAQTEIEKEITRNLVVILNIPGILVLYEYAIEMLKDPT